MSCIKAETFSRIYVILVIFKKPQSFTMEAFLYDVEIVIVYV